MLKIVKGDLLKATETYLCHQCNCISKRAAHLAGSVFTAFPYADVYSGRQEADTPGTIKIRGNGRDERLVINMFGQFYPGKKYPNSKKDGREKRASFFNKCLNKMNELEGDFAFPWRIGCGAAGGDWDRYLNMLYNFAEDIEGNVTIYQL